MRKTISISIVTSLLYGGSVSAETESTEPVSQITVQFKDGQSLRGVIVSENEKTIVLRLSSGGVVEVEKSALENTNAAESFMADEANRISTPYDGRYFYSPSAINLKAGQKYFSQKELFFSSIAYGVNDNVELHVGGILPLWLVNGGFNIILGTKIGTSVTDELHVAVGAQSIMFPGFMLGSAGAIYGSATLGNRSRNLSLSVMKPYWMGVTEEHSAYIFSGYVRTSKLVALIMENWFSQTTGEKGTATSMSVHGFGVRLIGDKVLGDVGAYFFRGTSVPIPWLDIVYYW